MCHVQRRCGRNGWLLVHPGPPRPRSGGGPSGRTRGRTEGRANGEEGRRGVDGGGKERGKEREGERRDVEGREGGEQMKLLEAL